MIRAHGANKQILFGFILLCFIAEHECLPAAKYPWRIKKRAQIGVEMDDNFRESTQNAQSEPSYRALLQFSGTRNSRRCYLGLNLTTGYQGYRSNVREDKFINEITGQLECGVTRWFHIGLNPRYRLKIFLYTPFNYSVFSLQSYFRMFLPAQFQLYLNLKPSALNYLKEDFYDYNGLEYSFTLTRRFTKRWLVEIRAANTDYDFKRDVITYVYLPDSIKTLNYKQEDQLRQYSVHINYFDFLLAKFSYYYELNYSNQYGHAYTNHWMLLSTAKRISTRWLWRISAMLQFKKYTDSLSSFIPQGPDYEEIDSNYLISDLSYRINRSTDIFLRLSWYKNESPLRAEYYQKQTITLGIDYDF